MSTPLIEKFLHYEETPPPSAWQYISGALAGDDQQATLAGKLNSYEVEPPPAAWTNIAAILTGSIPEDVPVKSNRRMLIYKLSAAAVIITVVCFGGVYLFTKSTPQPQMAISPGAFNKPKQGNLLAPTPKNRIQQSGTSRSLAILRKAGSVFTKKKRKSFFKEETKILRTAVVSNMLFADTLLSIMVNTKLIRNEKGAVIQNLSLLGNGDEQYIDVTSPNGEQTKISGKFLHALVYLRDNNYLDNFQGYIDNSFLESLMWKLRFERWRKKLLHAQLIPSSNNYLGILQFKELITVDEP